MGGGVRALSCSSSRDEEVGDFHEFSHIRDSLSKGSVSDGGGVEVDGDKKLVCGDLSSPASSVFNNALQMCQHNVYREILQSFDDLRIRSEGFEDARSKILSYSPGAWIENAGGIKWSDYNVPTTTSLLMIGPRGSGKSSLINRISSVFDDDIIASERAQVSYNTSADGTYFLREYMIPRFSTSFSLYDTRGLSDDTSENLEIVKRWMRKGVSHGQAVFRNSDSSSVRTTIRRKARSNLYSFGEIRMVNFVVFVVNGLSVLKSMDVTNEETAKYSQIIATTFNSPYLSFKDDKPVVVVTHGDLLSLSERARVRFHLGELLGIPPTKQIFDIPESSDQATKLTIVDMLRYSLEHADRNLPSCKNWTLDKVKFVRACVVLLVAVLLLMIPSISASLRHRCAYPKYDRQWRTWFDLD